MEVIDVDELAKLVEGSSRRKFLPTELNHYLAPQFDDKGLAFRMLVTGRAGAGKTNLIISAILKGHIKFEHLYLYARDPSQSKYQVLLLFVKEIEDSWERKSGKKRSFCTVITDPSNFIPLDDIDKDLIKLCLIDDMLNEKNQEIVKDYFIRGRNRNMNCIYLTQDYFKTDRVIRKQCQYYAVFGVSSQGELRELAKDHSLEHNYETFKRILTQASSPATNFLLIDRRTDIDSFKLRKNWDQLLDANLEFQHIDTLESKYLGKSSLD